MYLKSLTLSTVLLFKYVWSHGILNRQIAGCRLVEFSAPRTRGVWRWEKTTKIIYKSYNNRLQWFYVKYVHMG